MVDAIDSCLILVKYCVIVCDKTLFDIASWAASHEAMPNGYFGLASSLKPSMCFHYQGEATKIPFTQLQKNPFY